MIRAGAASRRWKNPTLASVNPVTSAATTAVDASTVSLFRPANFFRRYSRVARRGFHWLIV